MGRNHSDSGYEINIDVGGTFTDFFLKDPAQNARLTKTPQPTMIFRWVSCGASRIWPRAPGSAAMSYWRRPGRCAIAPPWAPTRSLSAPVPSWG